MCGIIGYVGKNLAMPILLEGLSKLEYRGYDSAGVATIEGSSLNINKTKGRIDNLLSIVSKQKFIANTGIGHTRWATHGEPSDKNSHPHFSNDNTIALVHNGIIENYAELKEDLIQKGYIFKSETDTETVVHLLHDFYKQNNDLLYSVFEIIQKIEGSYSLAIICTDYPDQIICAKKDSPLIIGLGNDENFIASDTPAILKHTRNVYLLEDNEVALITPRNITIFDKNKNPIQKEIFKIDWNIEAAEKDGYEHFMLKEIFEQPKVVKENINRMFKDNNGKINLDGIKLSCDDIKKIDKIYIVACGTAYYAGLVGKYLIESIARIPVFSEVASEFRYKNPIIDNKTLVIVLSQSGETADTLAAMRLAKYKGARVLSVVNVVGSTIAREAHDILYTLAGPEIAVASTKAFTAQVIAMYLLTFNFATELNIISYDKLDEIKAEIQKLPEYIDYVLKRNEEIKKLANSYLNAKNVFYVGRGLDNIISLEGSLKLKEVAYVHSEAYAAGELKHGSIALIEDTTLVFGLLTQEDLYEKTFSNLKEVKSRGAKVFVITLEDNTSIANEVDNIFYIPKTSWYFAPLIANIVQQLFAYYVSLGRGNDVDKPRNLAKSVTVE